MDADPVPTIVKRHHCTPRSAAVPRHREEPCPPPPQLAESILTASSPSCGALCLTLTPSQPAVSVHHSHSETCLSMCLPPLPT